MLQMALVVSPLSLTKRSLSLCLDQAGRTSPLSVKACGAEPSTLTRATWSMYSDRVNAMRSPSGDHTGSRQYAIELAVTGCALLPSALTVQISAFREKAILRPSGDQEGCESSHSPEVIWVRPLPSAWMA